MAYVKLKCNSPNIHRLDSVAITNGGNRRAEIDSLRTRFHIVDNCERVVERGVQVRIFLGYQSGSLSVSYESTIREVSRYV